MKKSDVRTILWGALLIGVIIVVGTAIEKWKNRDYEPWIRSRYDLGRIGEAYRYYHKQQQRAPSNIEDLDEWSELICGKKINDNLGRPSEDYEIYWNTKLSESESENANVILGYAKNITSRGVVVVNGDGVTRTMSVREFEKVKPK
jgi:hypothetical protein